MPTKAEIDAMKLPRKQRKYTHQEAFDRVVVHLRKQGEPSGDADTCLFRGPRGTQCAVGALVGDAVLTAGEKTDLQYIAEQISCTWAFLKDLQSAHDQAAAAGSGVDPTPAQWRKACRQKLANVAAAYELDASLLKGWR